jgi:hypothetical protein
MRTKGEQTTKAKEKASKPHYDTEELKQRALLEIKKHNLYFTDDVVAYLGISKQTYHNHGLDEVDAIKNALHENRVKEKLSLRKKFSQSESAPERIFLYKLLASQEEKEQLQTESNVKVTGFEELLKKLSNIEIE